MKYKGIELEGLDKDVKLAHSRFTEPQIGTVGRQGERREG